MNPIVSMILSGIGYDIIKEIGNPIVHGIFKNVIINQKGRELSSKYRHQYNESLKNMADVLENSLGNTASNTSDSSISNAFMDYLKKPTNSNENPYSSEQNVINIDNIKSLILEYPAAKNYFYNGEIEKGSDELEGLVNNSEFWDMIGVITLCEAYPGLDALFFNEDKTNMLGEYDWEKIDEFMEDTNNLDSELRTKILTESINTRIEEINNEMLPLDNISAKEVSRNHAQSLFVNALAAYSYGYLSQSKAQYDEIVEYINKYYPDASDYVIPEDKFSDESYLKASYAIIYPILFGEYPDYLYEKSLYKDNNAKSGYSSYFEMSLEGLVNSGFLDSKGAIFESIRQAADFNLSAPYSYDVRSALDKLDSYETEKEIYNSAIKYLPEPTEKELEEAELEDLMRKSQQYTQSLSETKRSLIESQNKLQAAKSNTEYLLDMSIAIGALQNVGANEEEYIKNVQEVVLYMLEAGMLPADLLLPDDGYLTMDPHLIMSDSDALEAWRNMPYNFPSILNDVVTNEIRTVEAEDKNKSGLERSYQKLSKQKEITDKKISNLQLTHYRKYGQAYESQNAGLYALDNFLLEKQGSMTSETFNALAYRMLKTIDIDPEEVVALKKQYDSLETDEENEENNHGNNKENKNVGKKNKSTSLKYVNTPNGRQYLIERVNLNNILESTYTSGRGASNNQHTYTNRNDNASSIINTPARLTPDAISKLLGLYTRWGLAGAIKG